MLIAALWALQACSVLTQSAIDQGPILEPAPAELLSECDKPVRLPDRSLTQAEVETFWLRDRVALIECGQTKEALIDYYRQRDAGLTG